MQRLNSMRFYVEEGLTAMEIHSEMKNVLEESDTSKNNDL